MTVSGDGEEGTKGRKGKGYVEGALSCRGKRERGILQREKKQEKKRQKGQIQ